MGIYSDLSIFGIKLYTVSEDDDNINTFLEKNMTH